MDTNSNAMTAVDVNEEEVEQAQKIDKPYGSLELVNFGAKSKLKGFSFYQKQYASTQAAINHVNSLGKNGEEIITGLINSAISFAARTKASNAAPKGETEAQTVDLLKGAVDRGEVVLTSEEDAEKYIPGTRERYALGYFQRAYMEARKSYSENKTEENKAKFVAAREALNQALMEDADAQLEEATSEPATATA